jgi:type IV pilus assembly protein PilA
MKERIQEALRRRHRKGDEGFTLIELLVVILIIAILAAVGIVALLSALNAGKKSAAKTTLRNAVTSIKSAQTGAGQTDYTNLATTGGGTNVNMNDEDPDLDWVATELTGTNNTNRVYMDNNTNTLVLETRSASNICYYALLDSNGPSGYASEDAGAAGTACSAPGVATPDDTSAQGNWHESTGTGWNL